MSRRDKQADLRRRMAEARAKLVTSSHANASDLDNEIATNTFKKRSLPSVSAGGILKKSKYSSSTPAVPPPPQTDTSKAEDNKSIDNVLGSLMADYGDSSDEDTNTNTKAASSNTNDQKQSSEPIQPATNNDIQQQMPKKKKKKKKKNDKPEVGDTNEFSSNKTAQLKSEEEENGKPTEVSDEVWDEFNALLDDDDDGKVAKDRPPLKSEDTNNSIPVEGETSTNSETTPTKKKKKKKGSKKKRDMYDNDDMNTVEQASYEARLARLMLLKSKKTQHKISTKTDEDNDEKLLSASTNEFYNGGLAFQDEEDGNDNEDDNAESIKANDNANLKSERVKEAKDTDDTNATTTSNAVASSISAPSVSLAAILRGRRDQARQLSRGNDKIDTANDDEEEDESWF